jgi:hypothetical protein
LPLNEGATRQLSATLAFDDGSGVVVSEVAWSVLSGPLTGISPTGLATAATVYSPAMAVARGTYQSFSATLNLSIVDIDPDNFGSYAGDGLADDLQNYYFGVDNPLAAPGLDPDGDGQTNRMEFLAGTVPVDGLSRFTSQLVAVPGQSQEYQLIFGPIVAGRSYEVESCENLLNLPWTPLVGLPQSDSDNQRTVTLPGTAGRVQFYRVRITLP